MKVEYLFKKDKSFEKALKRMEENLVKGRKRKYRVSVALNVLVVLRQTFRKEEEDQENSL
jgi:hypothetical protein